MSGIMSMLLGAVSSVAVAVDEFFNRVTLLLPGNGTNGAQNNTFLDSSSNNFTITRNGNTTQGTFSPFSQTGWSAFFNGTSAYASVASNAAFDFGTGDFTVEFWFYATAPAANSRLLSNNSYLSSGIDISWESGSSRISWYISGTSYNTGTLPALNTWHHLAYARSGTTLRVFLNGTLVNTYSSMTANIASTNALQIAIGHNLSDLWNGYISNLRIVKGAAVYTSAFTPSTTPLGATSGGQNPPTGTQTSLLTCQSNRFVDNGGLATPNTITTTNAPSIQAFSPFAPTAAYSAATVGGSGYFDGTGDYLSTPDNAAFDLGTGDFTFECWLYKPNNNDVSMICSAANGIDFAYVSGSLRMGRYPVAWDVTELYTIPQNAWTHIAFVKASGRTYLFANGTLLNAGGTANTNSYDVTTTLFIGVAGDTTSRILTGYMAGVRLIKGQALATASFTPPTAPVTTSAVGWTGAASSITGTVSLLLNYTNAGITDATAKNVFETAGNAQISTTQSKFGGSSMYFDGTGDYLDVPSIINAQFGTGDFTIEGWLYINSLAATQVLFEFRAASGASYGQIYITTGGVLRYYLPTDVGTSNTFSTGTWTHFAITRASGTLNMYINGTRGYSASYTSAMDATRLRIGADVSGASGLNAYIDDLRITKGFARYSGATLTVPTSAFALQ